MTAFTGTLALTRFILRRDRIRILIWIGSIVVLAALTVAGIKGLFPTQAALDQTAAATQHNSAAIAFNGPAQGLNSVGGQVAFQFGAGGMVLVALMSFFMVGRLTRGEEEAGRLELVRSLPVGIHANTLAAALTVAAMNVAVGSLTTAFLIVQGLPAAVGDIRAVVHACRALLRRRSPYGGPSHGEHPRCLRRHRGGARGGVRAARPWRHRRRNRVMVLADWCRAKDAAVRR